MAGVRGQARVGQTLRNSSGAIEKFDTQARIEAMAGLANNGLGALKTNENHSSVLFDASDAPLGSPGHFRALNSSDFVVQSNSMLSINPFGAYRMNVKAKAFNTNGVGIGSGKIFYMGFTEFDIDGLTIEAGNHMFKQGSAAATLTRPLGPGDTKIYISDGTGWDNGSGFSYQKCLRIGNYRSASGIVFGAREYGRFLICGGGVQAGVSNMGSGLWATPPVNLGGGEWEITMLAPLPAFVAGLVPYLVAGKLPVGTPVCNTDSGGSFKYLAIQPITAAWLTAWQTMTGTVSGVDYTGQNLNFSPGTAGIKFLFLPMHGGVGLITTGWVYEFVRINLT